MRFYLLDRIISFEAMKCIRGTKSWSLSDEVFEDHFPNFPVVPGIYIIESMAQLLGILIERSYEGFFPEAEAGVWAMLCMVRNVKFRKQIHPGDRMELFGELATLDRYNARGKAEVSVDGNVRATGELVFSLIDKERYPNPAMEERSKRYFEILAGHLH